MSRRVAVGQVAVGWVAVGQVAVGWVAVGWVAVGSSGLPPHLPENAMAWHPLERRANG